MTTQTAESSEESALLQGLRWALDFIDDNTYEGERTGYGDADGLFAKHYRDAREAVHKGDPANAPKLLTALEAIAEYHYDGEEIEDSDDPVEMSIDYAFEVANEAIHIARAAIGKAEKEAPTA